jgi:hypothetical protein
VKNVNTPRTLADCEFTSGYQSARFSVKPTKGERIAGVFVAVVVGVLLALVLVHWSMQ